MSLEFNEAEFLRRAALLNQLVRRSGMDMERIMNGLLSYPEYERLFFIATELAFRLESVEDRERLSRLFDTIDDRRAEVARAAKEARP